MSHSRSIVRSQVRRTARARVLGAALLGTGIAWFLQTLGLIELPAEALLSVFLLILGLGLVLAAKWGPYWNLVFLGIVLALILTSTAAVDVSVKGGVGDIHFTPAAIQELRPYNMAVGDLHIDLTQISFPDGDTEVEGGATIGHIQVIVPDDVAVRVESRAGVGAISIFGMERNQSSFPLEDTYQSAGFEFAQRRLRLKLDVGIGYIEVLRGR